MFSSNTGRADAWRTLDEPLRPALSPLVPGGSRRSCRPRFTRYGYRCGSCLFRNIFPQLTRLLFERNVLNVVFKLNAPQVQFISRERAQVWFDAKEFDDVRIDPYCGVSGRVTGRKKGTE